MSLFFRREVKCGDVSLDNVRCCLLVVYIFPLKNSLCLDMVRLLPRTIPRQKEFYMQQSFVFICTSFIADLTSSCQYLIKRKPPDFSGGVILLCYPALVSPSVTSEIWHSGKYLSRSIGSPHGPLTLSSSFKEIYPHS
jgi:hypothetical protein